MRDAQQIGVRRELAPSEVAALIADLVALPAAADTQVSVATTSHDTEFEQWWARISSMIAPPARPRHGVREVLLTLAELRALPEFSWTSPTGVTIGRTWRRDGANEPFAAPARQPVWWLGRYELHPKGVCERYYKVRVRGTLDDLAEWIEGRRSRRQKSVSASVTYAG